MTLESKSHILKTWLWLECRFSFQSLVDGVYIRNNDLCLVWRNGSRLNMFKICLSGRSVNFSFCFDASCSYLRYVEFNKGFS